MRPNKTTIKKAWVSFNIILDQTLYCTIKLIFLNVSHPLTVLLPGNEVYKKSPIAA
jgi:hypothetical protein